MTDFKTWCVKVHDPSVIGDLYSVGMSVTVYDFDTGRDVKMIFNQFLSDLEQAEKKEQLLREAFNGFSVRFERLSR